MAKRANSYSAAMVMTCKTGESFKERANVINRIESECNK